VFCGSAPESKTREHVIPQRLIKSTGDPKRKANFQALVQKVTLPPWANVQLDIRQIRLPSRVAFRQLFLDISVANCAEGDRAQVMLWFLFAEFQRRASTESSK
jgi:hypothetical protein